MELSSLFLAGKGSALTSFFSTAFLVVFLPFCLVVYSLMPRRGKKYFLLAADCAFFCPPAGRVQGIEHLFPQCAGHAQLGLEGQERLHLWPDARNGCWRINGGPNDWRDAKN